MSQHEREEEARRDSRRAKAARKKAGSSLLGRLNHTKAKATNETATWRDVEAGLIGWLVNTVTEEDGLISFGKTRDGKSLVITIIHDGEKHPEYFGANADMNATIYSFACELAPEEGEEPPI